MNKRRIVLHKHYVHNNQREGTSTLYTLACREYRLSLGSRLVGDYACFKTGDFFQSYFCVHTRPELEHSSSPLTYWAHIICIL